MDNNPSKFFDNILFFLSSNYNMIFTIDEIKNHIYRKEIKDIEKSNKINDIFSDKYFETNIINAIIFLNSEGLVHYMNDEKQVLINTKGFIKIKTEGFSKEIKNKTVNLWLQRGTWVCSILALGISVYSLTIKNSDSPTTSSNCNCKLSTTQFGHLQKDKIVLKKSE